MEFLITPFLVALVSLASTRSAAAELSPSARTEIHALLHALGSSTCEFFRNGSWYDGAKAESHLERKFDYLDRKHLVASVDQFIGMAASRSSLSGEAYQVRCPGIPAEPSAEWLKGKLEQIRADVSKN